MNIPKKYDLLIVLRACVGFGGLNGFWGCQKYMPISIAVCIGCLFPTWTTLMARVILKETLHYYDIIATFTGLLGIVLINDPFNWFDDQTKE